MPQRYGTRQPQPRGRPRQLKNASPSTSHPRQPWITHANEQTQAPNLTDQYYCVFAVFIWIFRRKCFEKSEANDVLCPIILAEAKGAAPSLHQATSHPGQARATQLCKLTSTACALCLPCSSLLSPSHPRLPRTTHASQQTSAPNSTDQYYFVFAVFIRFFFRREGPAKK